MTEHPSDSQLYDFVDGELTGEELAVIQSHVQACRQCQSKLTTTKSLLEVLRSLPTEAHQPSAAPIVLRPLGTTPARFIRARLGAAAVGIFALGISVGVWVERPGHSPGQPSSESWREKRSEQVQHTGTDYVSAIANWRRNESSTPGAEEGREVVISTLYGAAHELQRLQPSDPNAARVVTSLENLRNQILSSEHSIKERLQ